MLEDYNGKLVCQVINTKKMNDPGVAKDDNSNTDFWFVADSQEQAMEIFLKFINSYWAYDEKSTLALKTTPVEKCLEQMSYWGKAALNTTVDRHKDNPLKCRVLIS